MPVDFRYAARDEYPRIAGFLNDYWAANHVYCRDRALFEWTFHRPGHWPAEEYSFALAEDAGDLVGILGGIPFTFNRFGARSAGIWVANYVIRPDHRRGPTALQLLGMFRQPRFHACVAFGINPATSAIYRVLRGEVLPLIPRHFLILPGGLDRMRNLLDIAHPDWEPERARALARGFLIQDVPDSPVAAAAALPDQWDREDWPELARRTIGAARDRDYLEWRYLRHPVFDYRVISIAEGARTGLAIWRLETIRRQTPEGRTDVDRIGRLVEFLPASRANAGALFIAFLQQLCAAGAFGADYYGFHGETRAVFEEMGFHQTSAHPDGEGIPSRFQPLDGKGGGILSAMFLDDRSAPCSAVPDCPWLWTKSDSDQDRPN